jgi:hypothetical protein
MGKRVGPSASAGGRAPRGARARCRPHAAFPLVSCQAPRSLALGEGDETVMGVAWPHMQQDSRSRETGFHHGRGRAFTATHPRSVRPPRRLYNRRCAGGRDTPSHGGEREFGSSRGLS